MAVLAIDYDGVIVDSDSKSLFIAYNAYNRIIQDSNNYIFGVKYLTFNNWEKVVKNYHKKIKAYKKLRPYATNANGYLLIIDLIKKGIIVNCQEDFDFRKKELGFDKKEYFDEFYKEKERIHKINIFEASKLEPIHLNVFEGIKQFSSEGIDVFITTLNRKEDVLKYFNFNYPFFSNNIRDILDIKYGENKIHQIKHIAKKYTINFNDIHFIDDQVSHLIQTKMLGIHLYLAGWGYTSNEQKKQARENNIPIIKSEKEFYPYIKRIIDNNLS
ncbi:hypothetical protein ES704_03306 [subsurface metagenome]|jgi:hypothetical protein